MAYKSGLLTTYDTWDDPPSILVNLFSASQRSECSRLCQLPWPSNGSKHATENDGWHSHWKKILLKKKGILYVITYEKIPMQLGIFFLGPLKKKLEQTISRGQFEVTAQMFHAFFSTTSQPPTDPHFFFCGVMTANGWPDDHQIHSPKGISL